MRETGRRVCGILGTVLVVPVVLLAMLLLAVRLCGLEVYTVLSGSMEPAYRTGSLICVRKIDTADIHPGTPITFLLDENTAATHRVVEVLPDEENPEVVRFRTKGDANAFADGGLVHERNVIGTPVLTLPYLGDAARLFQTTAGRYAAISACAVLLLLTILPELFVPRRRAGKFLRARRPE